MVYTCSHIIKDEHRSNLWTGSENSGNNAWNFNATNGKLNNNNKMNSNGVRASLDFDFDEVTFQQFVDLYAEYLDDYRTTRKHKRGKNSQLYVEYNLQHELLHLVYDIFTRQYIPELSNLFAITIPTLREVIAAWFTDRIPQTRVVKHMMPGLERDFFHKDSYSCREGKGGLKAVQNLIWYIKQESKNFTEPLWIYKFDIKSFFMSIDLKIYFPIFVNLAYTYIKNETVRDEIIYLARIIYLGFPQEHCVVKSHPDLLKMIKPEKRLKDKTNNVGVPIGNITSQMLCLIVTACILWKLHEYGLKFVHYTDDNHGLTKDVCSFMKFMKWLKKEVWEECHLIIHPDKFYLQYYKKTISLLGFKIKYGCLLLPGDRVVHNFKWKITCAIRKAAEHKNYMYRTKESFVGVLCSYLGLLKHTASYNLRKSQITRLAESKWGKILDFDTENYYKVAIKPNHTKEAYIAQRNKIRKQHLKIYQDDIFRNSEAA